jgi:hypothetical protein
MVFPERHGKVIEIFSVSGRYDQIIIDSTDINHIYLLYGKWIPAVYTK